jgi:hypothetical protein
MTEEETAEPRFTLSAFDVVASIVVMFSLGIAQPLLELLGRNAEFFVAHDLSGSDVALFAFGLAIGVPLVAAAIVLLVRNIHRSTGSFLHLLAFGGCVAAYASHLSRGARLPLVLDGALIAAIGVGAAQLFRRSRKMQIAMRIAAPLPLVLAGLFLFGSSAAGLVRGSTDTKAALVTSGKPIPVVLVVFDEFPLAHLMDLKGGIDGHLFPRFAQLAKETTWFRNATTVHSSTNRAVPAILSGEVPDPPRLPVASEFPHNVFTLLGGSHRIVATEPVTALCPPRLCARAAAVGRSGWRDTVADLRLVGLHLFLPRTLTEKLPAIDQSWEDFTGAKDKSNLVEIKERGDRKRVSSVAKAFGAALAKGRPQAFQSFVRSIEANERPTLYMFHAMLPHPPFQYLPDGTLYTTSTSIPAPGSKWGTDPWAVLNTYQRGLIQAQFVDRLAGELVDRLKGTKLWDDALVIITSDHGASFTPGTLRRTAQLETVGEIGPIPLFVKRPHQRGGVVDDRPAQSIDILPTIASLLGVEGHDYLGVSLFGPAPPADRERAILINAGLRFPLRPDGSDKLPLIARKYRLFPRVGDSIDLYGIGPHPELLGRTASSSASDGHRWSLDAESAQFLQDSKQSVPPYLAGTVDGAAPIDLALVIDGKVRAVTRSFKIGSQFVFRALIRPDLRDTASKRVEMFRIADGGRLLRLSAS